MKCAYNQATSGPYELLLHLSLVSLWTDESNCWDMQPSADRDYSYFLLHTAL